MYTTSVSSVVFFFWFLRVVFVFPPLVPHYYSSSLLIFKEGSFQLHVKKIIISSCTFPRISYHYVIGYQVVQLAPV